MKGYQQYEGLNNIKYHDITLWRAISNKHDI